MTRKEAESRLRRVVAAKIARRGGAFTVSSRLVDWMTLMVHRDMVRPGQWRVTKFDGDAGEATGHYDAGDYADAVKYAICEYCADLHTIRMVGAQ